MSNIHSDNETSNGQFFRPRRLGHVNLWVDDLQVSEDFYHQQCGLTVEFTEPDLIASFLGTGQTPHDLGMIQKTGGVDRYGRDGLLQLPGTIGVDVGLNHLAWELENEADLVAAYKNLVDHEIPLDITVDHQVAHSVYMFDPDGNYNEFYCDTVENWREVLHGEMDLITSQWNPLEADGFTEGRYDRNPTLRVVEQAPLHPQRVTHAVIQTADIERLSKFYVEIAGLNIVSEESGVLYFNGTHDNYGYNLIIVPADKPAYGHAAFELADETALEQAEQGLAKAGVTPKFVVDLPWKRSMFLSDPDGLMSEWYVRRESPRVLESRGDIPLLLAV